MSKPFATGSRGMVIAGVTLLVLFLGFLWGQATGEKRAVAALPKSGESMEEYLATSRELVRQEQYADALARFEWFYSHALEFERSLSGVRNSFFLSDWADLAESYPPAKTVLVNTRNSKLEELQKGSFADVELAADALSLNRALGEDNEIVTLFARLDQEQPSVAERVWRIAMDEVIKAERFDLVRKYIGPLEEEYARITSMYDHFNELTASYEDEQADRASEANARWFVSSVVQLLWVAKSLGEDAFAVVDDLVIMQAWP